MATLRGVIKEDNLQSVLDAFKTLTKNEVLIGVPAEDAEREPDPDDPKPANNAMIGYVNEFGSPAQNIPARPHLVPGVQGVSDRLVKALRKGCEGALDGKRGAADKSLRAAGLIAEAGVKDKITSIIPPELAPGTLAERKRHGFEGETPLVVTGQYRNSITSVLKPRGSSDAGH